MSSAFALDHYPFSVEPIPPGWIATSIDQIALLVGSGFASGEHNRTMRGVPHIRPMNIDREGRLDLSTTKYVDGDVPRELKNGDVLFNNTNSPQLVGKTTAIRIDMRLAYSNHMTRIVLERGFDSRFVAHQLHFLWMSGYFRHRCVNHVNQASISAEPLSTTVPVLVAPVAEQARIADALDEILSDLDAGVAALIRVREKLKLYRASVLKAAVEGVLTAEWRAKHPQAEPASVLLDRILAERRRRWEEDQRARFKARGQKAPKNWKAKYKEPIAPNTANLPPLPEGWCWATVDQLTAGHRSCAYGVLQPGPNVEGGIPLIRVGDINLGRVDESNLKCVAPAIAEAYGRTRIEGGEMLITLVGTIGRTAVAPESLCGANTARAVGVVPLSSMISASWVEMWFRNVGKQNEMTLMAHEVARKTLNLEDVRQATVAIPTTPEQGIVVETVEDQLSVIGHVQADLDAKLQSAQGLRQATLRHAFAGRLVPHDPNDEPASDLLKRIAAERDDRARAAAASKHAGTKTNGAAGSQRGRPKKKPARKS